MTLELKGFRLSRGKTEYMHCCFDDTQTHEGTEIQLGNQTIQQVDKFRYLGSIIQKDCEVDSDVNNRIQAGWVKWRKATGIICDCKVEDKIKGECAKLDTVNFQMDNSGTPKLDGAKPSIVNKNGTDLASPLS